MEIFGSISVKRRRLGFYPFGFSRSRISSDRGDEPPASLPTRKIRKIDRGLYDSPKSHPKLGKLHTDPQAIVATISRRDGTTFRERESFAANRLHPTEQVRARMIYLTDMEVTT